VSKNREFDDRLNLEESEWDGEDDGPMDGLPDASGSDLLPAGDLRCLYLGWLRSAQDGGLDEMKWSAVPAGPARIVRSFGALMILEIDEDLVDVCITGFNHSPLDHRRELSGMDSRPAGKGQEQVAHYCVEQGRALGETTSCRAVSA